jgi:pimeloyl-ACP methyl ester carboxylesterase
MSYGHDQENMIPRRPCITNTLVVVVVVVAVAAAAAAATSIPTPPSVSPATGLPNLWYQWQWKPRHIIENNHGLTKIQRQDDPPSPHSTPSHEMSTIDQSIRYMVSGPTNGPPVVLVHGLFVNADHWRYIIPKLATEGYRVYALDLFGCGYSSKPPSDSENAQLYNGERYRFESLQQSTNHHNNQDLFLPEIRNNQQLGTSGGGGGGGGSTDQTRTVNIELRHPVGSPYNFYTWADCVSDFCHDVVLQSASFSVSSSDSRQPETITLVANSIGTITAMQVALEYTDLCNGLFVVSPNFRELHSAEVPFSTVTMPLLRQIQKLLRNNGQSLFNALAKPDIVRQILKEPYHVTTAIDDTLVAVLLDPLLTPGASSVVFDTLSYSAGPLPEQQLSDLSQLKHPMDGSPTVPVYIGYGTQDPWTPSSRVKALSRFACVQGVTDWPDTGHCPHDENPDSVLGDLLPFLYQCRAQYQTRKQLTLQK